MDSNDEDGGLEEFPASPYHMLQQISGEAVRVAAVAGEALQNVYLGSPRLMRLGSLGSGIHRRTRSEFVTSGNGPTQTLQRLRSSVQSAFSPSKDAPEETFFNPEILANQKRQWYQCHSKTLEDIKFEEPSSLFEHFIIAGIHPDADLRAVEDGYAKRRKREIQMEQSEMIDTKMMQGRAHAHATMEPQILFKYPPGKSLPTRAQDLAAFCFPGGVKARVLERTPSLSELNELVYGQGHLCSDDSSFIFSLKVGDNATLYGVCLHVREFVQRQPAIFGASSHPPQTSKGCSRVLVSAPRCYCLLTRVPFFELHHEMLNSIIAQERLNRITQFVTEMTIAEYVPLASKQTDPVNESADHSNQVHCTEWMESAITMDSAIPLAAAAAGIISDDGLSLSSSRSDPHSPTSATNNGSPHSQCKETGQNEIPNGTASDDSRHIQPRESDMAETPSDVTSNGSLHSQAKQTDDNETHKSAASDNSPHSKAKETEDDEIPDIIANNGSHCCQDRKKDKEEIPICPACNGSLHSQGMETDKDEIHESAASDISPHNIAKESDDVEAPYSADTSESHCIQSREMDKDEIPNRTASGCSHQSQVKEMVKDENLNNGSSDNSHHNITREMVEVESPDSFGSDVSHNNQEKETDKDESLNSAFSGDSHHSEAKEIGNNEIPNIAATGDLHHIQAREMDKNVIPNRAASYGPYHSQATEMVKDETKYMCCSGDDLSDASGKCSPRLERSCDDVQMSVTEAYACHGNRTTEQLGSVESLFSSLRSTGSDDEDDGIFSCHNADAGIEKILKWAKENGNNLLQIVCGYHALAVPLSGNEIVFKPLEHLQAIEYQRPPVHSLGIGDNHFDLEMQNSLNTAKVKMKLAAVEEAAALAIWTTSTICRVLSLENVLTLVTGVLLEKQVVIVCPNLGVLSATVLSLIPMILPFEWQSLFLPVLPGKMFDFLEAPVPFIVGIQHKPDDLKMKTSSLVQVNVAKDQVKTCLLPSLPRHKELIADLGPLHAKMSREKSARRHPVYRFNKVQAEAATEFLAIMRCYLDSLCSNLGSHTITSVQSNNDRVALLLKESFVDSFPDKDRPFIKLFVDTQLFMVLSDSRLSRHENGYH